MPNIALFGISSVDNITVIRVQVLALKTVLLNSARLAAMRSLNSEESTLLLNFVLVFSEWNSVLIKNEETFREELEESFIFSTLAKWHKSSFVSHNTTLESGDHIIEFSILLTFNFLAHPLNEVLMSFALDINKIDALSPEVTFLLWSNLSPGPIGIINSIDGASIVGTKLVKQQLSSFLLVICHRADILVGMSRFVTTIHVKSWVEILKVALEQRVLNVLVQSSNSATFNLVVLLDESFGCCHSRLLFILVSFVTNPNVDHIVKLQDIGLISIQMLLLVKRTVSDFSSLHLSSVI